MHATKDSVYLNKLIAVWLEKKGLTLEDLHNMTSEDMLGHGLPEIFRVRMFELRAANAPVTVDAANKAINDLTASVQHAAEARANAKYDPKVEIKEIVDEYVETPTVVDEVVAPVVDMYDEDELRAAFDAIPASVKSAPALLKRVVASLDSDRIPSELATKLSKEYATSRK